MHISSLWEILQDRPQLNFLEGCQTDAKKTITRLILSTDMAFHSQKLLSLKALR